MHFAVLNEYTQSCQLNWKCFFSKEGCHLLQEKQTYYLYLSKETSLPSISMAEKSYIEEADFQSAFPAAVAY